ncbi:MAG: sigma-70 family RNA polymerase sigma factor [Bryobacterales bacterium]|nr:sigma-70 family RNA polymerase sigma factor [Bryobacterales bacterium]
MHEGAAEIPVLSLSQGRGESARDASTLSQTLVEVFSVLRSPIYRYLLSSVGNRPDAEDLTQEAFLRLVRVVRRGAIPDNPKAWLFEVAHNLLIDRQRGSSREPSREELAGAEAADGAQGTEDAVACRERLEQYFAGLSPSERRCMELRLEGLRYREIAEILQIRIPTVQTMLTRAAKKLSRQAHEQP